MGLSWSALSTNLTCSSQRLASEARHFFRGRVGQGQQLPRPLCARRSHICPFSSVPLQHPASSPRIEMPSPSPLPFPDLLTHTTLLKAREGQDGWSTFYPGAACFLSLPAGAGKSRKKGTPRHAPAPDVGSGAWLQHLLGWESLVQVRP